MQTDDKRKHVLHIEHHHGPSLSWYCYCPSSRYCNSTLRILHKQNTALFFALLQGKMLKIGPKINKIEIWPKTGPKCLPLRPKKWRFRWPNQSSQTTFIVQTFPKYCHMGFHFMKSSLLSPILAKFQFC